MVEEKRVLVGRSGLLGAGGGKIRNDGLPVPVQKGDLPKAAVFGLFHAYGESNAQSMAIYKRLGPARGIRAQPPTVRDDLQ